MIRRAACWFCIAAISALLVVSGLTLGDNMTAYRSTLRYCLRLRAYNGRIALLYDGGTDVFGPVNWSLEGGGTRIALSGAGGWQYGELSAPAWLLVLALGIYPTAHVSVPALRRRRRKTRGECVNCGYSLMGNVSGVCPECGKPFSRG